MKKLVILLLSVFTLFTACDHDDVTVQKGTINPSPFVEIDEEFAKEQVDTIDWIEVNNIIPADKYIQVDGFHTMPRSATLYKNSECIDISVDDPRLVRLWNFYTNEVNCGIYSYSQGTANNLYEIEKNHNFRLELEFFPSFDGNSIETRFDKIIIVQGKFYCIMTDVPFETYDYSAFLRIPLFDIGELEWLSLFGF